MHTGRFLDARLEGLDKLKCPESFLVSPHFCPKGITDVKGSEPQLELSFWHRSWELSLSLIFGFEIVYR